MPFSWSAPSNISFPLCVHSHIVAFLLGFDDLDSVGNQLHAEGITRADHCLIFDAVGEKYPIMEERFLSNSRIFHLLVFEKAAVKVLNVHPLLAAEEATLYDSKC